MAKNNTARESFELFDNYRSQRRPWMAEVAKDYDYYLDKQWSEQDRADLMARGKAPLVFNIIRPHIDGKKGIIAANAPTFRCLPRGDEDVGITHVMDSLLNYIWYNSHGQMQFGQSIHEYCIPGVGWMQADIDPFADDSKGEVVVRYLPYNYVYVDPTARRKDFSDARRIFISMRVPRETALMLYPDQKAAITKCESDGESDWPSASMHTEAGIITPADYDYTDSSTNDYIRIIERYELGYFTMYALFAPDAIHPEYLTEEAAKNLSLPTGYSMDEIYKKRCRRVITLGESITIADEILPVDDYPIVPIVNIHTSTPYPIGDVRGLRDPQDEKNKRRMVIIHHAMAAGTNRVIAPTGAVDVPLWEQKIAMPGAVLEYNPMPNMTAPSPFPVEQIPNAFFAMEEKSERDVEYISGIHPSMLGDPTNAPDTYRATLMLEEAGTRRIRGNDMATIEHSLGRLGRVVLQLAQAHYKQEKVIRVIGESNTLTKHILNEAQYDDESGKVSRVINDLSIGKYDVICVAGSTLPTNRMAQEEKYKEWYSLGLVDREAALRKSDIAEVDEILARFGEMAQMQGVLEQQGEELKNLEGMLQSLRRQLIQQNIKMTEKEFELLKQAELVAVQAQAKVAKVLMTSRADTFARQLTDTQKLVESETRTKAKAALEVSKERLKSKPGEGLSTR